MTGGKKPLTNKGLQGIINNRPADWGLPGSARPKPKKATPEEEEAWLAEVRARVQARVAANTARVAQAETESRAEAAKAADQVKARAQGAFDAAYQRAQQGRSTRNEEITEAKERIAKREAQDRARAVRRAFCEELEGLISQDVGDDEPDLQMYDDRGRAFSLPDHELDEDYWHAYPDIFRTAQHRKLKHRWVPLEDDCK